MKTFFTLISILCVQLCMAQTASQTVYPTKNLNAYAGTWEYATATDTFRIVLIKGITSFSNSYDECLIGGYRYVKNGVVMGNYTQGTIPSVFQESDFSINNSAITVRGTNSALTLAEVNPNVIRIYFKDMGLGKTTSEGQMQLLSPTQARWTLKDRRGVYVLLPGESPPVEGFSVPTDLVLTKIADGNPPAELGDPPLPPIDPKDPEIETGRQ